MATLSDIVEEKKKFFDSAKNKFKAGVTALFELVPELEGITWQQWVPGFNDGDAWEFTLGEIHFIFKEAEKFKGLEDSDEDESDEDYDDEDEDDYDSEPDGVSAYGLDEVEGLSSASRKLLNEFSEEFGELEDVLEKIFDANKEITVSRSGEVTVEDYDCGY